jgi:HAMP domain-containing protein
VGALQAWSNDDGLRAELQRRWWVWWLDLLITSLAVVLAVDLAVHFLVSRPLSRLVRGLDRLGNGHVGAIDPGPGAWEIRWLAWRFGRLGRDLEDAARQLVAAERRALDAVRSTNDVGDPQSPDPFETGHAQPKPRRSQEKDLSAVRYLSATARLLDRLSTDDPYARNTAEHAWTQLVSEADRIGEKALKARLEDSALKILEPTDFAELDGQLSLLRKKRERWIHETVGRLADLLHDNDVSIHEIQQRTKNTAGVWRKMREHQLALDQVHDLFAFRLIVADEAGCYRALGAVHRAFEPEPFRFKDYIAQPKPNGYRSLHTSVRDADDHLFEVQIRTPEMHHAAEEGAAAHWRYRDDRWARLDRLRPVRRRWWHRASRRS